MEAAADPNCGSISSSTGPPSTPSGETVCGTASKYVDLWRGKVLLLFDLDGTLAESRQRAPTEILALLRRLKNDDRIVTGIVSGSNEAKIREQLGVCESKDEIYHSFVDLLFSENGTVSRLLGDPLGPQYSIQTALGESNFQEFINFALHAVADVPNLPAKRGHFIECRSGMVNVSPVGRSCSLQERLEFYAFDQQNGVRAALIRKFAQRFEGWGLQFAIGGQISIDCFPVGWDKRLALRALDGFAFSAIHFFGDRTAPGGNDYEIFVDPRTRGHEVRHPGDTQRLVREIVGYQRAENPESENPR